MAGEKVDTPPPDQKMIIDKIAEFVSGKGRLIENKIIEREKDNPDFDFLKDEAHQYRPYYEFKLEEYAKSKGMHVVKRAKVREEVPEKTQKAHKEPSKSKKTQDDIRREMNRRKNMKPPPADQYNIVHPQLPIIDAEIIKITAQFVTRNGKNYLAALSERQSNNPQFDFLKPTHKLFTYFTSLLDQYSKCFVPKADYISKLKKYSNDQFSILETCGQRYEYQKYLMWQEKEMEREKQEKATNNKTEDFEAEEVDWDDFIVVQVIDFEDEDDRFLEPDIISKLGIEDVSTKIDKVDQDIKRELFQMEGITQQSEIEPGMKIVENYDKRRNEEKKEMTQVCPRCNKSIPVSEWQEHLRIELLDPNWRKEKVEHINRSNNPMTAQGDQITKSLNRMISKRPDIAQASADAHLDSLKSSEISQEKRIIWDGHSNTITRTTANSAMLAQQRAKNIEEAMRVHSQSFPNSQSIPPHPYQPPNTQGQFVLRPPNQTTLLGYPAPPPKKNQNQSNTK